MPDKTFGKILAGFFQKQKAVSNLGEVVREDGTWKMEFEIHGLEIEISLGNDYPHSRALFRSDDLVGLPHCLSSGYVCLETPFAPNPKVALELDWKAFLEWLDKYYLYPSRENEYRYPALNRLGIYMIFDEGERPQTLRPTDFGKFGYTKMSKPFLSDPFQSPTFMATDLGGRKAKWSDYYHSDQHKVLEGIWYFFGNQPPELGRSSKFSQKDLKRICSHKFQKFLDKYMSKRVPNDMDMLGVFFPLLIGFWTNEGERKEIHWEFVMLPVIGQNYYDEERAQLKERYNLDLEERRIDAALWGTSINASYNRFFGRGVLPDRLTQSKILVVGVGALGGSLSEILARGGCLNISLVDPDQVETGNICRSVYRLSGIHRPKSDTLALQLHEISPFVSVKFGLQVNPSKPESEEWNTARKFLSEFDFIFDCTASQKFAWSLDQMDLPGENINLSVTDEAREFIFLSNKGSIADKREELLKSWNKHEEPPGFFEGIGCWHPTFKAGYAELNAPLNMAVTNLVQQIESGLGFRGFVLKRSKADGGTIWKYEPV